METDPDKMPLVPPTKSNAGKPPKPKVVVWFDRARDCLCIADRMDEERKVNGQVYKYEEGMFIPDPFIVRIPLMFGEEFIEAVFNVANTGSDFCKIMDGIQRLLDGKTANYIDLSEQLRSELAKRSGGGVVQASQRFVQVGADRFGKMHQLHRKVCELFEDKDLYFDAALGMTKVEELSQWMQERGLYEPGQLPQAEEGQHEGQP